VSHRAFGTARPFVCCDDIQATLKKLKGDKLLNPVAAENIPVNKQPSHTLSGEDNACSSAMIFLIQYLGDGLFALMFDEELEYTKTDRGFVIMCYKLSIVPSEAETCWS
jgi:hypothetical protein